MKLFDTIPDYTRLDDDVSFQILRTNPKLTTNTKLMYDGDNMYLESYSANALLSTNTYKNFKVYKTGLFNNDIKNFLLGTSSSAYYLGKNMSDTIIGSSYDNQFENMYWCGAESINSSIYPQELGVIAPLYLRKKRPDFFVIFKIDTPANTNLTADRWDNVYDFKSDVLDKAKIIKSFDLREGTIIGDYISKYVGQKGFKYDKSVYVNFSSKQIYYYGIDKSTGVLTEKTESISEQMLDNDFTIIRTDDWVTNGFVRNNMIFPYIINFEFLFDDNDTEEYHFGRYFGMYCNATDLYDLDVSSISDVSGMNYKKVNVALDDDTVNDIDYGNSSFSYIKDKYDNIYSIDGNLRIYGDVDEKDFTGYEKLTTTAYCEKMSGVGYTSIVIEVNEILNPGEKVYIYNNSNLDDSDDPSYSNMVTFTASGELVPGDHNDIYFSSKGTVNDTAAALAGVINDYSDDIFQWLKAYAINNKILIQTTRPGSSLNGLFDIKFSQTINSSEKITKLMDSFDGGTDESGCRFKVLTSDKDIFFDNSGNDRDMYRYIKCYNGRDCAKILNVIPYISDTYTLDDTYSIMITDYNGEYVNTSKTNQIEILDRFYAKLGVLNMFPVKDFDFDTVDSIYGEDTVMQNEISDINDYLTSNGKTGEKLSITYKFVFEFEDVYEEEDIPDNIITITQDQNNISSGTLIDQSSSNIAYDRFYSEDHNSISNEYDYYYENLIPSLTTVSKTVPFIAKWGYMDESKDSCENPYRLNTSKIFDACNFSANTFRETGDIMEYTHSMPYYVVNKDVSNINEYQYIKNPLTYDENSTGIKDIWMNYFQDTSTDNFGNMFGDTSSTVFNSKRFNRKYSKFLMGSDISNASTLFRGVKFELINMVNGKEIKTSIYNDYRFSFIYIPVNNQSELYDSKSSEYDYNHVYFIKNDTFKYIVGMVFFYTYYDQLGSEKKAYNVNGFNKSYVYCGCLGFDFHDEQEDSDGMDDELADIFNKMTINNIRNNINNTDYNECDFLNTSGDIDDTYKIKIIDPDSITTYDIFKSNPVIMKNNDQNVIGSVEVGIKSNLNSINLKIINRYSGYYNPIFKDILFYNNYNDSCRFSNTSFDYEYEDNYGKFGIINNFWFHKINEDKSIEIITELTPYYPLTGQYALDYRDYNIFSTNWDSGYYTKQLDTTSKARCFNIASMKNGLCMFGSKYMNVPEEIEIECFSGCDEWNDDRITNNTGYSSEIMYKEINNNSVNFYMFLHKRIIRYFCDMLVDEFSKYVNPEYSYGSIDSINDDIEEYVTKNIIKLYELKKIRVFIKRKKMGVNDSKIENEYTEYVEKSVDELISDGFEENTSISMTKVNTDDFDRKIVYNLKTGEKESFGFSFMIKKK